MDKFITEDFYTITWVEKLLASVVLLSSSGAVITIIGCLYSLAH